MNNINYKNSMIRVNVINKSSKDITNNIINEHIIFRNVTQANEHLKELNLKITSVDFNREAQIHKITIEDL